MPRLGQYELRSVLGRGATGVVYEARSDTGERVAVKLIDAGFVRDEAAHDRLRREATILCALRDDHLVRVVEFVDSEAEPYLVVEYVDGASLRAVLGQTSRLAPADLIEIMDDLLVGLGVAHDHGVIHRDVKPENVLVDRHGMAKLADFGLALSRRDASTPFRAGEGTPAYMSPEQVRGESLDARSDLYGAGCVLHELLTGGPPFVRDSAFAVMEAHTAAEVPPMADVPDALTAVTQRALQKDPAQRFDDANAFRAALDAAATRSYAPAVLAAGGALSGIVAGLASQTRSPKPSFARRLVRRVLSRPRLAPALAIAASAVVVAGVATIALTRHSAAAGWKPVLAASAPVRGVTCVRSACYAVGGTDGADTVGVAATSTDGGRSWQPSRLPAGTGILRHISCASRTRCVAVGGVFGVRGRPPGEIVTTVDGGAHWQRNVVSGELSSVACVAMRCSAVGGGIFTSADGGRSWAAQNSTVCLDGSSSTPPRRGGLGCLAIGYFFTTHLVDPRHGLAAGFNQCGGFGVTECPGGIARTDDGGRHWSLLASSERGNVGDLPAVDAVTCVDRLHCRALASTFATSELLSTDDGGAHWKVSSTPLPQATDLSCRDATHCVATGFDTSRLHRPWLASFANGTWRRETLPSGVTGVSQLACTGSRCWIAATTTAPGGRPDGAVLIGAPTP